jgi:5-hydroxyisourate hydrolase-like protein (transthyretin family)
MRISALIFSLFSITAFSQSAPSNPAAPPAQVSGHVTCADTGQPARFASVQLIAEQPNKDPIIDPASMGKNPDFSKAMAQAMTAMMKGSNLSAITGLDGSFSLDKVPPGTYYVVAQLPGYLSPLSQFSMMERMKADNATLKAVKETAEKIVLTPNQPAHLELRIERGASISGVIHYDDGSPAPGVAPVLMKLQDDGKWKPIGQGGVVNPISDDRGRYRIAGIAAGKYAVKAALPTTQATMGLGGGAGSVSLHMNMGDALEVYSGGAMGEKDVKPVEVGPGADVDGVDVIFPLDNLHTVSGSVVARSDGHPVNTGMITLMDPDGKTTVRSTMVEQDGTFKLNYIPEGQYVLHTTGAADMDQASMPSGPANPLSALNMLSQSKTLKSYGEAELPITVKGDSTGLSLQVPDPGAAPAAAGAAGVPTK